MPLGAGEELGKAQFSKSFSSKFKNGVKGSKSIKQKT